MTITAPQATVNRIQTHFSQPQPQLPANYEERKDTYTNAVFAAVMFFQSRLQSHDSAAAERAALAILDLEKTRLRHSRPITGTSTPFDAPLKPLAIPDLGPLDPDDDEEEFEEEDLDEDATDDEPVREDGFTPEVREKIAVAFENFCRERDKHEAHLRDEAAREREARKNQSPESEAPDGLLRLRLSDPCSAEAVQSVGR